MLKWSEERKRRFIKKLIDRHQVEELYDSDGSFQYYRDEEGRIFGSDDELIEAWK